MNCLYSGDLISCTVYGERIREQESQNGLFRCPRCQAEHVRRRVGTLPSGEPLYTVRLWRHATRRRRRPDPSPRE